MQEVLSGNPAWALPAAALIVVVGVLCVELIWRYANRRLSEALKRRNRSECAPYITGFIPPFRLLLYGAVLKLGERLVSLSVELTMFLHGLQALLIAVAALLFFFQVVRVMEFLVGNFAADSGTRAFTAAFKSLKIGLRSLGLIVAAISFIHIQRDFFPEWLWKSSWWRYPALAMVVVIIFLAGHFLRVFLAGSAASMGQTEEKTRNRLILEAALKTFPVLTPLIAIYTVISFVTLAPPWEHLASIVVNILGVLVVFLFLFRLIDVVEYELTRFVEREDNTFDRNLVLMVRVMARVLVVAFSAIYLLQVVTGKPMTSILAGLGIGGLAVALAAQDTLKNLFGSFMIMLDKPFVVGDWVKAQQVQGVVEDIGFRSTKIRTFEGNVVSVPNDRLAASNIENVQRRPSIRRWADITITYDTPPDKVERAVAIIKEILTDREEIHPDIPPRVYFSDFNDTSLNILMVYYFRENNYWGWVEFNEKINFEIMRAFEAEGIEMAFPTTTAYLAQDDRRPLNIRVSAESHSALKPVTP